jgi:hypothetical protein
MTLWTFQHPVANRDTALGSAHTFIQATVDLILQGIVASLLYKFTAECSGISYEIFND